MARFSLRLSALFVGALLISGASVAQAEEWQAKDGSQLAVYGSVDGPEWEAFIDGNYCTPTGGSGDVVYDLYCDGDNTTHPEAILRVEDGVIFRGKLYRLVK